MLRKTLAGACVAAATCGLIAVGAGTAGAAPAPAANPVSTATGLVGSVLGGLNLSGNTASDTAKQSPADVAKMLLDKLNSVQAPAGTPGAAQLAQARAQLEQIIQKSSSLPNLGLPEPLCSPLTQGALAIYNALRGLGVPDGTSLGLPPAPELC